MKFALRDYQGARRKDSLPTLDRYPFKVNGKLMWLLTGSLNYDQLGEISEAILSSHQPTEVMLEDAAFLGKMSRLKPKQRFNPWNGEFIMATLTLSKPSKRTLKQIPQNPPAETPLKEPPARYRAYLMEKYPAVFDPESSKRSLGKPAR